MKRLLLVLVPLALVVSGCAFGEPKPPTEPSASGVTLNANVYSSFAGETESWFVYGAPGDYANWQETTHQTLAIDDTDPHPVSEPISGLSPSTTYGWKICVADQQESPRRVVCSDDGVFATVGDYVRGFARDPTVPVGSPYRNVIFNNLRSGPNGENPAGSTIVGGISNDISCLRVDGTHATIGFPDGSVYFINFPDGPLAAGTYEPGGPITDPTNCPAFQNNGQAGQLQGDVTIHDEP